MSVDHVFHGVSDEIAAGQGVQHPRMAHGNTVVDSYRVELAPHSACFGDSVADNSAHFLEVDMAWYELGIRIGHRDDGFVQVLLGHPRCAPQSAGPCHDPSLGCRTRAKLGHRSSFVEVLLGSIYSWADGGGVLVRNDIMYDCVLGWREISVFQRFSGNLPPFGRMPVRYVISSAEVLPEKGERKRSRLGQ